MRNAYSILVGKPERKGAVVRPGCRWEVNIVYLRKIWWEGVNWVHLAQDSD
jgi:hypothetical protein